jgi:hypothetical protein
MEDATANTIILNDMTDLLVSYFDRTLGNRPSIAQSRIEHLAARQPLLALDDWFRQSG